VGLLALCLPVGAGAVSTVDGSTFDINVENLLIFGAAENFHVDTVLTYMDNLQWCYFPDTPIVVEPRAPGRDSNASKLLENGDLVFFPVSVLESEWDVRLRAAGSTSPGAAICWTLSAGTDLYPHDGDLFPGDLLSLHVFFHNGPAGQGDRGINATLDPLSSGQGVFTPADSGEPISGPIGTDGRFFFRGASSTYVGYVDRWGYGFGDFLTPAGGWDVWLSPR